MLRKRAVRKNGEPCIHPIDNVQSRKYIARALVLAATTRPRGQRGWSGFRARL